MAMNRRSFLQLAGTASLTGAIPMALKPSSVRAAGDTLTIAYNVSLPSWDPTTGLSSVNPGLQSIWKSVFDQYIDQNPDLSFKPGVLSEWGWNSDKTRVHMKVRDGATWQDGKPITGEDIVWNLNRAANPESGNPVGGLIWGSVGNLKANGNEVTGDVNAALRLPTEPQIRPPTGLPLSGLAARLRFQTMSSPVIGFPSCQVAPSRTFICTRVLSAFQPHSVSTPGLNERSGFWSIYWSKTDFQILCSPGLTDESPVVGSQLGNDTLYAIVRVSPAA